MGDDLISKRLVIEVVVEDTGGTSKIDMLKVAMDALAETLAEEPASYPAIDGTVEDHRGELYDQILEAGAGVRQDETVEWLRDKSNVHWLHRIDVREGPFWDELEETNPKAVIFDAPGERCLFDSCIVGIASRMNFPPVLVYDADQMTEALMKVDGIPVEEADEYLSVNTFGAWLGDGTPLVLRRVCGLG